MGSKRTSQQLEWADYDKARESAKRLTKSQRLLLEDLLCKALMETASFGKDDKLIKSRTRPWRDTWLVPKIIALLGYDEDYLSVNKR